MHQQYLVNEPVEELDTPAVTKELMFTKVDQNNTEPINLATTWKAHFHDNFDHLGEIPKTWDSFEDDKKDKLAETAKKLGSIINLDLPMIA